MDYRESRAYIKEAEKYGSVLGLDNMRELMNRLGNPQDTLKFVHVAGTNGKGSVIAYLYTVLLEAGYNAGRYISPTLYSYRERMECRGRVISREKFARYITVISEAIQSMTAEGLPHPTPFEIETAAAFLYFAEENCELVLLEVGLGGDMDATNIIPSPQLCIITSISMDHMAFLGNTLTEIAQKKAGIIKPGSLAVTAKQEPEVREALLCAAREKGVSLEEADTFGARILEENFAGQKISYEGETYGLSLLGKCQKENAVLALKALSLLENRGYPTTISQRKKGLEKTKWNGRFTVLREKPLFIVDGAHNPGAARKLVESIEFYFAGRRIYYIMGMFRDKDFRSVIQMTAPYAEKIFTIAAPGNERALSPQELCDAVSAYHKDVQPMESPKAAVKEALALAGAEDVILAFGSLAFIGEVSEAVKNERGVSEPWI